MSVLIRAKRYDEVADLIYQMQRLSIWRKSFYDVALIAIPGASLVADDGEPVMRILKKMRDENLDNTQILCLLGNLHLMRREFVAAENCYSKAAADPDQPGASRAMAVLLAARGEAELAKEHLQKAIAADPDAEQLLKLANLVMQLTPKKAEAAGMFDTLRAVYPENEALYEAQGAWFSSFGDWKNLARILQARIETHETADALSNLGAAYMNLRHENLALKYLNRAVKLDAKQYSAWYNLSSVLTQRGKEIEAFEAGKKAFKLGPQHVGAASQLALIAGKLNQNSESERILKRGLKHNPNSAELLNLLGNCKLRRGDMKGALECFDKARENAADNGAEFGMQLMAVNYSAKVPPEIVADMHFKWGDARVAAVKPCAVEAPSAAKAKLKIGYMSGDYKNHSCSFFLGPLIASHRSRTRRSLLLYDRGSQRRGDAATSAAR